ncbi:MAG: cysteine desulfurase [Chloroflexota bacterium]|nr:cysteine desulfurase [Chloroflexota bacterium]
MDVQAVRLDFPILAGSMQDQPLVYLDSGATSQKPRAVIDAVNAYYSQSNANVHRGIYALAEEATALYEAARATIATWINASTEETIFTRNATEAINLVAYTWGREHLQSGDVVLLTPMEHHSNLVPWHMLAAQTGAEVAHIDLLPDGRLDLESLDQHLAGGRVKLVATTYISNVLGTIVPVQEIARRAHAAGAVYLVDGSQAVPHLAIDVRRLDVDFLAFTGHKMLGPMGIGVLYGRRSILEDMPPFMGGGEMIRRVDLFTSTWNQLPWKFEAGTPSVGDAVGLGVAVDYLQRLDMEVVAAHDRRLAAYTMERLRVLHGVTVHGPEERGALVAFSVEGIHPHDLASLLDERGIAVRAGHHCAQPLHDWLGVPATTRASFYVYNQEHEIDLLAEGIEAAQRVMAP